MSERPQNIQDVFLNTCRKEKQQVTVYLTSGVKLQGIISGFDNFSVVLRRSTQTQLVYKHSIATVVPMHPIDMYPKEEQANTEEYAHTEEELPTVTGEGSFEIA